MYKENLCYATDSIVYTARISIQEVSGTYIITFVVIKQYLYIN